MNDNEVAIEMFGKDYDELSKDERDDVDEHLQFLREERI